MTSTLRFNLGDVRLRDEERRQLQKLQPAKLTSLAMRKIDWGGAGQISEALGQDRCGSSLPINRYFFAFFAALSLRGASKELAVAIWPNERDKPYAPNL